MRVRLSLFIICYLVSSCGRMNSDSKEEKKDVSNELNVVDIEKSNFCGSPGSETPTDPLSWAGIDIEEVDKKLSSEGIDGYMHGAVPSFSYYVMNYGPTLRSLQFNLVALKKAEADILSTLKRHDKVRVFGKVIRNHSPAVHIHVDKIEILKKYKDASQEESNQGDIGGNFSIGEEEKTLFGKVHAVIGEGAGIVMDYQGLVIPVLINSEQRAYANKLYRNDIIQMSVLKMQKSHGPLHLISNPGKTMNVVDHMANCHGKEIRLKGILTLFEKSPQINRDVFAIKVSDSNEIQRNFTLFPGIDPVKNLSGFMQLFEAISSKMQSEWSNLEQYKQRERNSYSNPKVVITAYGKMNIVSKNQANPQLYISDLSDIDISYSSDL